MRRRPRPAGYDKLDPAGRDGGNPRNGMRAKTVLTETGPGQIEMPGSGTARPGPVIVRKRQRRLDGMSQTALSLTARGHYRAQSRSWPSRKEF
jgi:transposase-like protein